MRLVTFASGSGGNCALVSAGETHLLIDAGISLRRISQGLARQGLGFGELSGVLVTHEHADHIAGLGMLLKHHPMSVYAPPTLGRRLCGCVPAAEEHLIPIEKETPFFVKDISVLPFPTSHDVDESVGYRLEGEGRALGFCTDTGCVTAEMERYLSGCGGVLIEANHDEEMLRYGPYPVYLKRRILSDRGHLSNELCARLSCELACAGTASFVLGHLSRENNTPAAALEAVRGALEAAGFGNVPVRAAPPDGDLEMEVPACCVSG